MLAQSPLVTGLHEIPVPASLGVTVTQVPPDGAMAGTVQSGGRLELPCELAALDPADRLALPLPVPLKPVEPEKLSLLVKVENPLELLVPASVKLENPVKLLVPASVKLENPVKLAVENPLVVPIEKLAALLPPPHAPVVVNTLIAWAQELAPPAITSASQSVWASPERCMQHAARALHSDGVTAVLLEPPPAPTVQ